MPLLVKSSAVETAGGSKIANAPRVRLPIYAKVLFRVVLTVNQSAFVLETHHQRPRWRHISFNSTIRTDQYFELTNCRTDQVVIYQSLCTPLYLLPWKLQEI